MNNLKLTKLALDWISFICDDCIASDRKTFRWAVLALEHGRIEDEQVTSVYTLQLLEGLSYLHNSAIEGR